jgi:2-dehydro-3-deoxyphosphogluconate aldolase/(4S)-4-hydroxy-2-oxoglutarate aldolase
VYDRLEWYRTVLAGGLVPLFYHGDAQVAGGVAAALVEGGAAAVEFTNRGPGALRVFQELAGRSEFDGDASLGVGSIVDAPTAALFIAAGARFVVSPMFNAEVARLCNRRRIPYLPGCATPTEIATAEEWGVEIVKVFPGKVGGPAFIKDVLGPMPWSRLMPTGGVQLSAESLTEWFSAGACCVGMGSDLVRRDLIAAGDYRAISANVRTALELIRQVRGG